MILAIGASYQSDAPFSGQNKLRDTRIQTIRDWLARTQANQGRDMPVVEYVIDVECTGESAV
jgi:hypothetical protein